MDNITKYKLSNYTDIKPLDSENRVFLCYDNMNDRICVRKLRTIDSLKIYKKLKSLDNELLPKVYDILIWDEEIVVIEEYIKGRSIEEIVEEKTLPRNAVIKYSLDIAEALISIHSKSIIHRDISPDNIIIDENDRARLLDFDIARMDSNNKSDKNMDTTILGTAGFASPEQFGFAQTDMRSDIFSLGEVMNYMLTGVIVQNKMTVDSYLAPIVEKATKFNPSERYNSVNELCTAINSINSKKYKVYEKFEKDKNKLLNIVHKIPGFRTGSIRNGIIAAILYITYLSTIFDYISGKWTLSEFLDFTWGMLAMCFIPMWWFGDNGKNWDLIRFVKYKNKNTKLIAAIAAYAIMFVALVALACIIEPTA